MPTYHSLPQFLVQPAALLRLAYDSNFFEILHLITMWLIEDPLILGIQALQNY